MANYSIPSRAVAAHIYSLPEPSLKGKGDILRRLSSNAMPCLERKARTGRENKNKWVKEKLSSSPSVCGGHKNVGDMYYRPVRQKQSVLYRIDKNLVSTRSGSYKSVSISSSISSSTSTRRPIRHGPCVPSFLAAFAHSAVARLHQDSRFFPWPNIPKCIPMATVAIAAPHYKIKPLHSHHSGYQHQCRRSGYATDL
jgi:hypothetical protein